MAEAKLEDSHHMAYYKAERATQRGATVPPTTSEPIFKQRPNAVQLG